MITRTADTDDDGTGTTGTVHNNAWKTAIYDALDGRWSEATTTLTGLQDNLAYAEADVLRCNNATAITVRGLLAPASPVKPGKRLILVSVGAGSVVLNDQDVNSTAANRIITGAGAAVTLAAGTGWASLEYDSVTARWRVVGSSAASGTVDNAVNDFRLSLTTAVPITTTDVTAATTIYCTPYRGNRIALFDGTNWNIRTSAEFSIALGTLTSGLPYDVFCYDNAGVPTLELLAWTSTTARATALALQDGVLSKTGALTRRFVATFHTTSTTTTEDSEMKRFLWNYYNRAPRTFLKQPTGNWTYTTATVRQANADATNQVEAVIGWAEEVVQLTLAMSAQNSSGTNFAALIGIDSTTTAAAGQSSLPGAFPTGLIGGTGATYADLPAVGYHKWTMLEWSTAVGTTTWYGKDQLIANKSGLTGWVRA